MAGSGPGASRGVLRTAGHPAAAELVRHLIAAEAPLHALLLAGPRGVGKTTLALDLAAGLLCLDGDPAARPCRACVACRKTGNGNHPDLHLLAPEGAGEQIRVGQVQELAMTLALLPLEGRCRVAIISAAQRLNVDAQNALLKTLEEPGPRTCLVLCADDLGPLLPTIVSRAARSRLVPLPVETLTELLVARTGLPPAQARGLALAAGGRPGLALALSARPEAAIARARIARRLLDLVAGDRRSRLGSAGDLLADGATFDAAERGELAPTDARLAPPERRRALTAVLEVWRGVGRDLWLAIRGDLGAVRDHDLLEELRAAAAAVDSSALARFLQRLDGMTLAVEGYASPELVLDSLLLAWAGRSPAPLARPA